MTDSLEEGRVEPSFNVGIAANELVSVVPKHSPIHRVIDPTLAISVVFDDGSVQATSLP
jgi:hypothetical protein